MMRNVFILFLISLASQIMYLIIACRQAYIRTPFAGQYCMNYFNLRQSATLQTCVLYCMHRPECRALSYNVGEQTCLLTAEPCVTTEADPGYVYMTFKGVTEKCLTWQLYDPSDTSNVRMIRMAGWQPTNPMLDVVLTREVNDTHMFIPYTELMYMANFQPILVVAPGCSTTWVEYTAGDPLPQGAVPTGGQANGNPTYVIRVRNGLYWFGYYERNAAVGYYHNHHYTITTTVMEMLIEI